MKKAAQRRFTMRKPDILMLAPLDLGESARRDMILNLEDMGFEIQASHHKTNSTA